MIFDKEKIKELYPEAEELMIQPMLIHSSTDEQVKDACSSGKYFGQEKKDGALYFFVKTKNHSYLFGRTVSKKTGLLTEKIKNVPHIESALSQIPENTVLLGEIYYPNKTSKDVVSIMGSLPEKAIARQKGDYGFIHYYIYDILVCAGVNLIKANTENLLRYKILEKIMEFNVPGLKVHNKFIELADIYEDNLYDKLNDIFLAGGEGMVFKKKDGVYEPGKRPLSNIKAKKVDYFDAVIIGFGFPTIVYSGKEIENWEYWIDPRTDFKERENIKFYPVGLHYDKYKDEKLKDCYLPVTKQFYYGWYNSKIEIGAYDENNNLISIGMISSGIPDIMKKDMSLCPELYLGEVCAIECMELDKKALTLRHGFFKYLRKDKNKTECLVKNIFKI